MDDGDIDLIQSLAEELLEGSAYEIIWYNASVYDPLQGGIVEVSWDENAIGSGLIQADKAVELFLSDFNN